jgi:hypothetical protein
MTNSEAIKYIRQAAKSAGLTFRVQRNLKINGGNAYCFTVRNGGDVVLKNCTLGSAFENVESGFVSSWDSKKGVFAGI